MQADPIRDSHPNVVRRGPVGLAFLLVVAAGSLGGAIGLGLVRASCREDPPKLQQLLRAAVAGYHVHTGSCAPAMAVATLVGALIAAIGAGIVARLVLRAMTDWKKTPARPSARSRS